MSNLKPCPFCGGKKFSIFTDLEGIGIILQCDNLDCHGSMWIDLDDLPDLKEEDVDMGEISISADGLEPLFEKWNRRSK